MAYSIEDNHKRILSENRNKIGLAIRFMLDDIHRESRPKTPMKTGQLRGDVVKKTLGRSGKITWGKKYAWYQERGYTSGPVRKYTTPGTNKHFARNAVTKVAIKNGARYFKRAGL